MSETRPTKIDRRFMAEAIALSRQHLGQTGTNPSVGTLIVRFDESAEGVIVGRGVTAIGGRPHAEAQALAEAGERARGATAYVTLEPCAHHGKTPPCAEALIAAGVARVVSAISDPDDRVAGRGYAMLREAGIDVIHPCEPELARSVLGAYLNRSVTKRAQVTLKLAVSADGMIGRRGESQVPITGPEAKARAHLLRAEHDAILIGSGTVLADNPELTCRLEGMKHRSPTRILLDTHAMLPPDSRLMQTISEAPVFIATVEPQGGRARQLAAKGATIIACAEHKGRIALPELMEDLAARGITSVMVEGGAKVAEALLADGLVWRIALFESDVVIGKGGVASPLTREAIPAGFHLIEQADYGADRYFDYIQDMQKLDTNA